MKKRMRAFFQFSFIAFFSSVTFASINLFPSVEALSAQVTIAWDPNTEMDLAGYRIYYGFESGIYTYSVDVGDQSSYSFTDMEPNRIYYFAVTAYSISGHESDFSEEISFLMPEENLPPVADAGPDQTVLEGAAVILNGNNSTDPNGDIFSHIWEQTDGPPVALLPTVDGRVTFTSPSVGPDGASLSFRLTVLDSTGLQSEDYCIVNVSWGNIPPAANASLDQAVDRGDTVILNGSDSSDPDDGIASFLWEQTGGPTVNISDPTGIQPVFVAPDGSSQDVSLTFQLTVEDAGGLRSRDTCVVNVSSTNIPPVADAGPDQQANTGNIVTLDGSSSFDPDDGVAFVRWKQLSGKPVRFWNPLALKVRFIVPDGIAEGESLTFQITVTDIAGLASQDACTVMIGGNGWEMPLHYGYPGRF